MSTKPIAIFQHRPQESQNALAKQEQQVKWDEHVA